MNHVRGLLVFGALIFMMLGCIEAFKSNGATDHPLIVEKIPASESASVVPWRLLTVCTPNRTNIPHYTERTA